MLYCLFVAYGVSVATSVADPRSPALGAASAAVVAPPASTSTNVVTTPAHLAFLSERAPVGIAPRPWADDPADVDAVVAALAAELRSAAAGARTGDGASEVGAGGGVSIGDAVWGLGLVPVSGSGGSLDAPSPPSTDPDRDGLRAGLRAVVASFPPPSTDSTLGSPFSDFVGLLGDLAGSSLGSAWADVSVPPSDAAAVFDGAGGAPENATTALESSLISRPAASLHGHVHDFARSLQVLHSMLSARATSPAPSTGGGGLASLARLAEFDLPLPPPSLAAPSSTDSAAALSIPQLSRSSTGAPGRSRLLFRSPIALENSAGERDAATAVGSSGSGGAGGGVCAGGVGDTMATHPPWWTSLRVAVVVLIVSAVTAVIVAVYRARNNGARARVEGAPTSPDSDSIAASLVLAENEELTPARPRKSSSAKKIGSAQKSGGNTPKNGGSTPTAVLNKSASSASLRKSISSSSLGGVERIASGKKADAAASAAAAAAASSSLLSASTLALALPIPESSSSPPGSKSVPTSAVTSPHSTVASPMVGESGSGFPVPSHLSSGIPSVEKNSAAAGGAGSADAHTLAARTASLLSLPDAAEDSSKGLHPSVKPAQSPSPLTIQNTSRTTSDAADRRAGRSASDVSTRGGGGVSSSTSVDGTPAPIAADDLSLEEDVDGKDDFVSASSLSRSALRRRRVKDQKTAAAAAAATANNIPPQPNAQQQTPSPLATARPAPLAAAPTASAAVQQAGGTVGSATHTAASNAPLGSALAAVSSVAPSTRPSAPPPRPNQQWVGGALPSGVGALGLGSSSTTQFNFFNTSPLFPGRGPVPASPPALPLQAQSGNQLLVAVAKRVELSQLFFRAIVDQRLTAVTAALEMQTRGGDMDALEALKFICAGVPVAEALQRVGLLRVDGLPLTASDVYSPATGARPTVSASVAAGVGGHSATGADGAPVASAVASSAAARATPSAHHQQQYATVAPAITPKYPADVTLVAAPTSPPAPHSPPPSSSSGYSLTSGPSASLWGGSLQHTMTWGGGGGGSGGAPLASLPSTDPSATMSGAFRSNVPAGSYGDYAVGMGGVGGMDPGSSWLGFGGGGGSTAPPSTYHTAFSHATGPGGPVPQLNQQPQHFAGMGLPPNYGGGLSLHASEFVPAVTGYAQLQLESAAATPREMQPPAATTLEADRAGAGVASPQDGGSSPTASAGGRGGASSHDESSFFINSGLLDE